MTETQLMNLTTYALPFMLGLIAVEAGISAVLKRGCYKPKDFFGSMSQLALNIAVILLTKGVIFILYLWLNQNYGLLDFGNSLWAWLGTLVAIDFVFYWYHRFSHRVELFWAAHVVHHSSEEMNFGTALRQSWSGPFTRVPFYFILPIIGFDPVKVTIMGSFATIYGFWTHTKLIPHIPIFGWIFVTPAHHRAHHGSNDIYIDKNYANLLIIWDRLFGTFQAETEQVKYGIKGNINSFNPLKIALHEWRDMWRRWQGVAQDAHKWRKRWRIVFGTPEAQQKIFRL